MNSSDESDDALAQPTPPAEPAVIDVANATPPAPAPLPPAAPGLYWCEQQDPGLHPVLGQIVHGENDYSGVTHPDSLIAIAALVEAGVLRKA